MASTIKSDNGVSSGVTGIVQTADSSGQLALQTTNSSGTAVTALTLNNSQQATFANTINVPNTFGFKNRIINGGMVIDQRNAGASGTPSGTGVIYYLDRWYCYASQASKFTMGQNLNSVTPPTGFSNYYGLQVASAVSIGATDRFLVTQGIEAYNIADLSWGTANAATVTLSFWVRSSLTGTFGGSLGCGQSTYTYPFTYTISSANTWTYITITIAGPTAGTWTANNSGGVYIQFGLGVGSTYSGAAGSWSSGNYNSATGGTSVVGTASATWYITGVQLEVGTQATSFDYRPYGTELAFCQRYYCTFGGSTVYEHIGTWGSAYATTAATTTVVFPVSMRTIPSLTYSGSLQLEDGVNANVAITSVGLSSSGIERGVLSSGVNWFVSSGLTVYRPYQAFTGNSTSAYVGFSAEL